MVRNIYLERQPQLRKTDTNGRVQANNRILADDTSWWSSAEALVIQTQYEEMVHGTAVYKGL
jgi:hypothetical protein